MAKRDGLVPVLVVDKNGRTTTVHKRLSPAEKAKTLPAIGYTPPKFDIDRASSRINARAVELSGKEINLHPYKVGEEHLRMAEELINNPDAGKFMPFMIESHLGPLDVAASREWLKAMNRNFSNVMNSGLLRGNDFDEQQASSFIGAIPHASYGYYRGLAMSHVQVMSMPEDEKLSSEQELNIALLNLAAWGSGLEGRNTNSNGMYGPTSYVENDELINFAVWSTRERADAACRILKQGGVTRFSEVLAILDKEVAAPVASGWL